MKTVAWFAAILYSEQKDAAVKAVSRGCYPDEVGVGASD